MLSNLGMFRSYDVRTKHGVFGAPEQKALAEAVAVYFAEDLGTKELVLARDARLYCPELMETILGTFLKRGFDIYVNPLQISTCQFYYMCMTKPEAGGIMVTASHNPSEYIGIKLVGKKCSPIATGCGPEGGLVRIKEYYEEDRRLPDGKRGRLHYMSKTEEFVDYSMALAGLKEGELSGLRVFAEFLSGAAGTEFLLAFTKAGAEVEVSHLVPDGFFPAGAPNPVIEPSVAPARKRMRDGDFDIGFCFDGDGDRMDLMYPDGEQIIPGLNTSVLIPYIKEIFGYEKPKCFCDLKALPVALVEIAKAGVEPHIIRYGHSFIKEKLTRYAGDGYMNAVEESAHNYLNFPVDGGYIATENTLFFALLSARAMKEQPGKYKRAQDLQKGIYRFREFQLHYKSQDLAQPCLDKFEAMMREKGAVVVKAMDDGTFLDATLMRINLPEHFTKDTVFPDSWVQVSMNISRSEDAMSRWDIAASSEELCKEYSSLLMSLTDSYVEAGLAHY